MNKKKVVIYGAGFSGLCLAHFLLKRGVPVEVREKSGVCGGLLGSHLTEWGHTESAANGLLASDDLSELCEDIGVKFLKPLAANKKRYIFRGRLMSFPVKLMEWPRLILFALRYFLKSSGIRAREFETLQEWAERNFSKSFAHDVILTGFQGIYGANTGQLSATLLLRSFFGKKKDRQTDLKGTLSFKGGMGELIQELVHSIESRGGIIHLNTVNTTQDTDDVSVIATGLPAAKKLFETFDAPVAHEMKDLKCAGILSVTCFFKPTGLEPRGFGCLLPTEYKFNSLGVLFNTDIFSHRSDYRSETYIMPESYIDRPKEDVIENILADRSRLAPEAPLVGSKFYGWHEALPVYDKDLEVFLRKDLLNHKSPYVVGNYLGEIGLSKILSQAKKLAEKIGENEF